MIFFEQDTYYLSKLGETIAELRTDAESAETFLGWLNTMSSTMPASADAHALAPELTEVLGACSSPKSLPSLVTWR